MKKIVMIGPVCPFKGGISHYTGMMVRNLKKDFELYTISFKLQYPKILFKKEQRDYTDDTFCVDDAEFLINTANPFNWPVVSKKIEGIVPDYIIMQWWHPYFTPCYIGLAKLLKKYPIIFVCHNVFPHERFPGDRILTGVVLGYGSGFITHSQKDTEDLKSIIKAPSIATSVHPSYNIFNSDYMSCKEARGRLGISDEKKVLLFFGFVREYKGLKYIIKAMPEIICYDRNIELMIVGEFGNDKKEYFELIEHSDARENIHVVDKYVPDKEIQKYFAACDIVILPYKSATQSGIVQVAYGFNKPVIATKVGGLPEVVSDGETGYLVEPQNPHELARAVIRFFNDRKSNIFAENIRKETYRYSWDRMNEAIVKLIERIDEQR